MIKLAILFLIAMVALGLTLGRPKRGDAARRRREERKRVRKERKREPVAEATRCPKCGAWVMEGEVCNCGE